jgi:hypothetical protein
MRTFLDRDFQNFWEVRRFGRNWGMRVICPCCSAEAPERQFGEEIDWTGYRKWRWLSNHIVSEHSRDLAMTHRHRIAVKKGDAKLKEVKILKSKRRQAG